MNSRIPQEVMKKRRARGDVSVERGAIGIVGMHTRRIGVADEAHNCRASLFMIAQEHVDELDGLRAVAIVMVMVRHFADPPPASLLGKVLGAAFFAGSTGVDLFFVLSGFLITGICLDHRGRGFFRAFYARRALRIIPAYAVIVAVLTGVAYATSDQALRGVGWIATFTTNIGIARAECWCAVASTSTHLWSLAVEEQFYLVWPLLVIGFRRCGGIVVVAAAAAVAPLVRGVLAYSMHSAIGASVLMPGRMDALAIGALLAIARRTPPMWGPMTRRLRRPGSAPVQRWFLAFVAYCYGVLLISTLAGERFSVTFGLSAIAISCGILVAMVLAADTDAPIRRWLRRPMARTIGRRSYAMYLFHVPLNILARGMVTVPNNVVAMLTYTFGAMLLTYALADLSWRTIERRALSLKRHFRYEEDDDVSDEQSGTVLA